MKRLLGRRDDRALTDVSWKIVNPRPVIEEIAAIGCVEAAHDAEN